MLVNKWFCILGACGFFWERTIPCWLDEQSLLIFYHTRNKRRPSGLGADKFEGWVPHQIDSDVSGQSVL